jgi:L-asparaginase
MILEKPSLKIFTTGGTIDKVVYSYGSLNYVVGDPQIRQLLEESNVRFTYTIESICKKDSLEMTDPDRQLVFERVSGCTENKVIITHGTDTIIETAKVLKPILDKTIVLTGAILPAKFYDTDAKFNIGGAVIAAQVLPPGLYLVMNGLILDPLSVKKNTVTGGYDRINSSE